MLFSRVHRRGRVIRLQATLFAAALMGPVATAHAWPVSPSIEPAACGPAEWCSSAGRDGQPEGAPAGEAAPSSLPDTPPRPAASATVAAPIADEEEPQAASVHQPSSSVVPGAAAPEVVPDRIVMFDIGFH